MTGVDVHERLLARLDQQGVAYEVIEHGPSYTCEESAAARGTTLAEGGKALLCRVGKKGGFQLFVMPSDARLSTPKLRRVTGERHFRFASREELAAVTGLTPGAVPPFGSLFDVPTIADRGLGAGGFLVFNAGRHEISLRLGLDDYLACEAPQISDIVATD